MVNDRPRPRFRLDYILISTVAVALNPTDVKGIAQRRAATDGLLVWDFSGVVLEIGPEVTQALQGRRQRLWAYTRWKFNEGEDGAWAEIIAARETVA